MPGCCYSQEIDELDLVQRFGERRKRKNRERRKLYKDRTKLERAFGLNSLKSTPIIRQPPLSPNQLPQNNLLPIHKPHQRTTRISSPGCKRSISVAILMTQRSRSERLRHLKTIERPGTPRAVTWRICFLFRPLPLAWPRSPPDPGPCSRLVLDAWLPPRLEPAPTPWSAVLSSMVK